MISRHHLTLPSSSAPISRRLNSSGDTFRVLDEGPSPPPPRHCSATTSLLPPLMRIARTFLLSHHITSLSGSIRHWYLALAHNFILFKFRLSILLTNDKMELFCSLVSVACVPLLLLVCHLLPRPSWRSSSVKGKQVRKRRPSLGRVRVDIFAFLCII